MFVIRYGCPIASDRLSPFAGSGHAGIVLIRREMDRAILSALVTGGDKAEYYSEAVFREGPSSALIRRKGPPGGDGSEGLAWLMEHWGVHVLINRLSLPALENQEPHSRTWCHPMTPTPPAHEEKVLGKGQEGQWPLWE